MDLEAAQMSGLRTGAWLRSLAIVCLLFMCGLLVFSLWGHAYENAPEPVPLAMKVSP